MRRTGWLIVFAATLALVPVPAALSGGFDILRFERQYYVSGEVARGSTKLLVDLAAAERDGPFHAHLLPNKLSFELQANLEAAVPLGATLSIVALPEDDANDATASIEFTVPQVSPGKYQVALCNRPCRTEGVGNLVGGWIHVVATAEEASLFNLGAKLERRLQQRISEWIEPYAGEVASLRNISQGLDSRLSAVAIDAGNGQALDENLLGRVEQAESQLAGMDRRIDVLTIGLASGWFAALMVAALWLRSILRAGRRSSLAVEDWIADPEELTTGRLDSESIDA
jgi:hypothetical protein